MIHTESEFGTTQVRPELDTHSYCGQHLSFGDAVTLKSATAVSDHALNIVLNLAHKLQFNSIQFFISHYITQHIYYYIIKI